MTKQSFAIDMTNRHSTHVIRVICDLAGTGWVPATFPSEAYVLPNRQLIELQTRHRNIRIRLSIYKVGDRGEAHRIDERRIEITTTIGSGLPRLRNWADVVLGYDGIYDAYVGLDPRRLRLGGQTHNASSSVDPAALAAASQSKILIRPHETRSLGLEYQAIFRPQRLTEYLFNFESIHDGLYHGDGLFSAPVKRSNHPRTWRVPPNSCQGRALVLTHVNPAIAKELVVPSALVEAYEIEDAAEIADLSPEELEGILRKCREVGDGGEHFVYRYERQRLHRARRNDLANKIDWVSQKAVGRGYDIRSFEVNGSPRFIEVKATIGTSATFLMSSNEWKTATRIRKAYWIYRVVRALDGPRIFATLQDPIGAEKTHDINRVPEGWRVTLL